MGLRFRIPADPSTVPLLGSSHCSDPSSSHCWVHPTARVEILADPLPESWVLGCPSGPERAGLELGGTRTRWALRSLQPKAVIPRRLCDWHSGCVHWDHWDHWEGCGPSLAGHARLCAEPVPGRRRNRGALCARSMNWVCPANDPGVLSAHGCPKPRRDQP